jgi:putative hydrolase of the HAD superfamily
MNPKYKHLFFDLDRTLWDFEKSAMEAFREMVQIHHLEKLGIPEAEIFHNTYQEHNHRLWEEYRLGKIEKSVLMWKRFYLALLDYGVDNKELAINLGNDYVRISPLKVNLFPHALETLAYLFQKYHLHLITNGFQEVQQVKLKSSGMDQYFQQLITSEAAGVKKPEPGIFNFAFQLTGSRPEDSLMIGDDYEVDIIGAQKMGMDQVFFDPEQQFAKNGSTYQIRDLIELKEIL